MKEVKVSTKRKQNLVYVDEETHIMLKDKSDKRGMTLKGYVKYLVNKDK